MKWPLTFYVDNLKPGFAGAANGPIIRISEGYEDDEGIYQHELVHVKQWFMTLGLHGALYTLSPKYKLWSEVMAYRKQLKYYDNDRTVFFARMIATKYGLDVDQTDVELMLRKGND